MAVPCNYDFFNNEDKKITNACSASSCFCCTCKTPSYVVRIFQISVLNSSKRLSILSCVTHPIILLDLLRGSKVWGLVLVPPREHIIHSLTMSSYSSLEMSPYPIKLSIYRHLYFIPLINVVFNSSFCRVVYGDHYKLYWNISTYSCKVSSSFDIILNIYSLGSLDRK